MSDDPTYCTSEDDDQRPKDDKGGPLKKPRLRTPSPGSVRALDDLHRLSQVDSSKAPPTSGWATILGSSMSPSNNRGRTPSAGYGLILGSSMNLSNGRGNAPTAFSGTIPQLPLSPQANTQPFQSEQSNMRLPTLEPFTAPNAFSDVTRKFICNDNFSIREDISLLEIIDDWWESNGRSDVNFEEIAWRYNSKERANKIPKALETEFLRLTKRGETIKSLKQRAGV